MRHDPIETAPDQVEAAVGVFDDLLEIFDSTDTASVLQADLARQAEEVLSQSRWMEDLFEPARFIDADLDLTARAMALAGLDTDLMGRVEMSILDSGFDDDIQEKLRQIWGEPDLSAFAMAGVDSAFASAAALAAGVMADSDVLERLQRIADDLTRPILPLEMPPLRQFNLDHLDFEELEPDPTPELMLISLEAIAERLQRVEAAVVRLHDPATPARKAVREGIPNLIVSVVSAIIGGLVVAYVAWRAGLPITP